MIEFILFILIWAISGVAGVIYLYTKEFDFTVGDVFPILFMGITGGPIAVLVWWLVNGPLQDMQGILIKKRGK